MGRPWCSRVGPAGAIAIGAAAISVWAAGADALAAGAGEAAHLDQAGYRAYKRGAFGDALVAFNAAWQADPQPKYLYNAGLCHEGLGDLGRAIEGYEGYLEAAGATPPLLGPSCSSRAAAPPTAG